MWLRYVRKDNWHKNLLQQPQISGAVCPDWEGGDCLTCISMIKNTENQYYDD
jgi:hypothetical protein